MKTVKVENILLPKDGVDFEKWAVVACDQFTSQPEYWEKLAAYVGNAPSTLNLIFPEVYLSDNRENRIKKINENMYKYLDENVFKEIKDSFVLVERDTPYEKGRLGLMMAVDLEEYDYTPFAPVAIRATEGTVLERIPPRVEIRRHAPLELPHIMLLIDDREHTVIEPLYENREKLELLYDTNLNMNGGHVRGWRVPDTAAVLDSLRRAGLSLIVDCDDFNCDEALLQTAYNLPVGTVKVLSGKEHKALEPAVAWLPESEGNMLHLGSFASFVGGLEAAAGAAEGEHRSSMVLSASVLISCILAMIMALAGGLAGLPLPALALYQVAWAVLAMIFPLIQRY